MIFFSAKLDEGSNRLGKALSFLVASPIILFVGVLLLNLRIYIEDEWPQFLGESFCFLIAAGFLLNMCLGYLQSNKSDFMVSLWVL